MMLHLLRIIGITTLIALCVVYPFLPGQYDSLAMPLSIMAQVSAVTGLLLVPIGILWLVYELRSHLQRTENRPFHSPRYFFALASVIASVIVVLVVSFVAFATVGISLALITTALGLFILAKARSKLRVLRAAASNSFSPVPLYLVLIPLILTVLQISLAPQMTSFSRTHAMASSREFIDDIEAYQAEYGRYPTSLLAMWKDYYPDVVGIEKFHYTPSDSAYNLFFEQPRFLLDTIGTREWVVYNPGDEHQIFSHTAWFLLLTPEELERSQGWYAVHETPVPHWRYFWFD
jgi:hypothetical protein